MRLAANLKYVRSILKTPEYWKMSVHSCSDTHVSESTDISVRPSGTIYPGTDYPLSFILTGAGSVGTWNAVAIDTSTPAKKIILHNEAVRFPMRFNFTRVFPAVSPSFGLTGGDIVTVSVRMLEDTVLTPLHWLTETLPPAHNPTNFTSLFFGAYSSGTGGNYFIYSNTISKGRTDIQLTPVVYPPSPPTTVTDLSSACLLLGHGAIVDGFHSIVWPVNSDDSTSARFRPTLNNLALGKWVWKRS